MATSAECSVGGEEQQQFCLKWTNFQSSLLASLPQLLDGDDLTDVTLIASGSSLKAHRVVLSACSTFFRDLFRALQPSHHPVVALPTLPFDDLRSLVTFMYRGEVNIFEDQLTSLLGTAEALKIRGLSDVPRRGLKQSMTQLDEQPEPPAAPEPAPTPTQTLLQESEEVTPPPPKRIRGNNRPRPKAVPRSVLKLPATRKKAEKRGAAKPVEEEDASTGLQIKEELVEDGQENHEGASEALEIDMSSADSAGDTSTITTLPQPTPSPTSQTPGGRRKQVTAFCPVCGKQLSNMYNLRVHMEIHQNRIYACCYCSHVSRSRDALRKHMAYRHGKVKDPPVP